MKISPQAARHSRVLMIGQILIWAIIGGAFLDLGAATVWKAFQSRMRPIQTHYSTNEDLGWALEVPDGSERLQKIFSELPGALPVVIVLPEGKTGKTFASLVVGYFAWPRPTHIVRVTPQKRAAQMRAFDRSSLSAIFFLGVEPPAEMQPRVHVGPHLIMVPGRPTDGTFP